MCENCRGDICASIAQRGFEILRPRHVFKQKIRPCIRALGSHCWAAPNVTQIDTSCKSTAPSPFFFCFQGAPHAGRTQAGASPLLIESPPRASRYKGVAKKRFFQNVFSPPIGSPLAGFGRYSGVRKLVPGGTFWAHSGPQGDKKQQKTKHVFENRFPPPPQRCSGQLLVLRRAAGPRGQATRRGSTAKPCGAACEARPARRGL